MIKESAISKITAHLLEAKNNLKKAIDVLQSNREIDEYVTALDLLYDTWIDCANIHKHFKHEN